MLRRRAFLGAALGLGLSACSCSETGIGALRGRLETEASVDFGQVQVGLVASKQIAVKNSGALSLEVATTLAADFRARGYTFSVEPVSVVLAPSESAMLTVSFQPLEVMAAPVRSSFELLTNTQDGDGGVVHAQVEVSGQGVPSGLSIEPNPLDFGTVLAGSSRTLPLAITNRLASPVEVTTAIGMRGKPEVEVLSGSASFEILSMVGPSGSLLMLAPGETRVVEARYTPDPTALHHPDRARWQPSNCGDSLCATRVEMIGMGTDSALSCAPPMVDFGGVNPGLTASRAIRCRNVATDTVALTSWALDLNSAPELSAGPFPIPAPVIPPNGEIDVEARYAPGASQMIGVQAEGTLVIRGINPLTGDGLLPVRVSLLGHSGGPSIAVLPAAIEFGGVAVHTRSARRVLVANNGYAPLIVSSASTSDPLFAVTPFTFTLGTGSSTTVTVSFAPQAVGRFTAQLILASNDGVSPTLIVPLAGSGVDIGPCAHTVSPSMVNFGVVPVGERHTVGLTLRNTGANTCLLDAFDVIPLGATSSLAFRLSSVPAMPVMLAPNATQDVSVDYLPRRGGDDRAALTYYVSDPADSMPRVPIFGTGLPSTSVFCPAPITVDAGTPVTLTAIASSRSGTITGYNWTVTSSPAGGMTPRQWDPDPPNAATERFIPYEVGQYGIRVTVVDNNGEMGSCDTIVTAISHGFRVQMIWDGYGDVDLHLHNATVDPWFGEPQPPGNTDDCFYANCSEAAVVTGPLWNPADPTYEGRNPGLDLDNIIAYGPENIQVTDVRPGDAFTIGVHYFWDHGFGARVATLNVFCGMVLVPNATYVSTPLDGLDQGGCTANTFWKVATVSFTSTGTCSIVPLQIYQTGQDACQRF